MKQLMLLILSRLQHGNATDFKFKCRSSKYQGVDSAQEECLEVEYNTIGEVDIIDFFTISSTNNATDFGKFNCC